MKRKGDLWLVIFSGIFLLVGMGMLVGGFIAMYFGRRFEERAEEVAAVITEIDSYYSDGESQHNVYVTYTYGGSIYENVELNYYSSGMYEGKEITILCDVENPRNIRTKGGMAFLYAMLIGMGVIFTVIGTIPIIGTARRSSRQKKIKGSGRKLYATVEEIRLNTSYELNGRNPYQIYCAYRDEYKDIVYRFKSNNIWTNPDVILSPGDTIPVYVDEKDYRHYYVDAESVLKGRIVDYT